MEIYTHIEERFCSQCRRNVGVEYTHLDDGSVIKRCLSKCCSKEQEDASCFFNQHE